MGSSSLTLEEQQTLLRLARRSIEHRARDGRERIDAGEEPLTDRLREAGGAFVTLTEDGRLRGCIGHIVGVRPLWEAVMENAVNAGWHDPRFRNLREAEVERLRIEVTVIHPLEPITGPEEVEVGKHGVLIETEVSRGVLLPQVASERGWDAETFLDEVCVKARLAPGTWRDPETQLWRFAADHFAEGEPSGD